MDSNSDVDSNISSDESYISKDEDNDENLEEKMLENCDMNDSNCNYMNLFSNFDTDFGIFISGVISGGLLGNVIAGGTLIFSLHLLFQKYIKDAQISNYIILLIYFLFFCGIQLNCVSYRILPSCEIGYNIAQSISNMNIDAKRASLLSISSNLIFVYNNFGMNVIILNCIFRSVDDLLTNIIITLPEKCEIYMKNGYANCLKMLYFIWN